MDKEGNEAVTDGDWRRTLLNLREENMAVGKEGKEEVKDEATKKSHSHLREKQGSG